MTENRLANKQRLHWHNRGRTSTQNYAMKPNKPLWSNTSPRTHECLRTCWVNLHFFMDTFVSHAKAARTNLGATILLNFNWAQTHGTRRHPSTPSQPGGYNPSTINILSHPNGLSLPGLCFPTMNCHCIGNLPLRLFPAQPCDDIIQKENV